MKLKSQNIINFNVDELEIYWTFSNYIKLFKWLNASNSDYVNFEWFVLTKQDNLKDYEYKIDFIKNNLKCFWFYVWKKINQNIKTRNYFVVYGSWLKLLPLNEIIDFIDTYIELDDVDQIKGKKHNTLKRLDLCIDINIPIEQVIKNLKKISQKWSQFYWNKWDTETIYIWESKKRLNRRMLIRIYNKLADIQQKQKQNLFWEYFYHDFVTRIEIEFRSELLVHLKLHQLLDRSYIFNLFITYIKKHTHIFDNIQTQEVEKLKYLNKKIDLEQLSHDKILKWRYIRTFKWYANKILQLWSCPIDILLEDWIISSTTQKDIHLWMENWVFNTNLYRDRFSLRFSKQLFPNKIQNGDNE